MTKLKLLVPTDGTDFSRRIEGEIRKFFPADRCQIRLLHVASLPAGPDASPYGFGPGLVGADYRIYLYGYDLPSSRLHPLYDDDALDEYRKRLEQELQAEEGVFRQHGYEVESVIDFGEPAQAIAEHADQAGVDLVAMASHRRHGLDRLLHGSVANRVVEKLSLPVLLLRVEADEAQTGSALREGQMLAGGGTGVVGRPTQEAIPTTGGREGRTSGDDEVVTPAKTGPARLAGIEGRGVVTLLRNDEDEIVGAQGSWFPERPDVDMGPLVEAERTGQPVEFDGPVVEAETAGHDDDRLERQLRRATIRSIRRYHGEDEIERILVSFDLVLDKPRGGPRDRLTRSEFDELSVQEVIDLTGIEPPAPILTREQEREFREKAFASYELDMEHRDEWGTARQDIPLPNGE